MIKPTRRAPSRCPWRGHRAWSSGRSGGAPRPSADVWARQYGPQSREGVWTGERNAACLGYEELAEVPVDPLAKQTFGARLEEFEDLVGVLAVHVRLLEEREGDAVVELAEALGALVVLGVLWAEGESATAERRGRWTRGTHLVAKLVRREAENDEALVLELLVDCGGGRGGGSRGQLCLQRRRCARVSGGNSSSRSSRPVNLRGGVERVSSSVERADGNSKPASRRPALAARPRQWREREGGLTD